MHSNKFYPDADAPSEEWDACYHHDCDIVICTRAEAHQNPPRRSVDPELVEQARSLVLRISALRKAMSRTKAMGSNGASLWSPAASYLNRPAWRLKSSSRPQSFTAKSARSARSAELSDTKKRCLERKRFQGHRSV